MRDYFHKRRQNLTRRDVGEKLRRELLTCLQERDVVCLCYDESVPEDSWVRRILPFQEFDGFLQRDWVFRLLQQAGCHHFMVLGDAPYIKEVLWLLAPRMKSLFWIPPDRAAEEDLEDFAEEFYQETGLAIQLQFLPLEAGYGQLVIPDCLFRESLNILDFTEGKYIPRFMPPAGSVWLDMASSRDKERRVLARKLPCSFVSLRKQWKNEPSS